MQQNILPMMNVYHHTHQEPGRYQYSLSCQVVPHDFLHEMAQPCKNEYNRWSLRMDK